MRNRPTACTEIFFISKDILGRQTIYLFRCNQSIWFCIFARWRNSFFMIKNLQHREYYIDWIRVLAFMILIFFHCSMPFVSFNWEIKNLEHSLFLDRLIIWLHQWRLPLLFFISGVGVSFSLRKRSVFAFFGERIIRLFIPLLFAMFFTIPSQVYFERLQKGQIEEGYWNFYPTVWDMVPYPEGTLTWSHMWFVVYLFVFTILLLPVFAFFKIDFIKKLKQKTDSFFNNPVSNLLLSIPFILYYFSLYVRWPEQGSLLDDWFIFNSSITFYFFGFYLADLASFWDTCEKYRKYFLIVSVTCAVVLFWRYYWSVKLPKQQDASLYLYGLLDGLHIWAIILTVVGYARHYLNFSNKWLSYLTSAVYPFYILHQTVIVGIGYYIVQWNSPIIFKLVALIVGCFLTIFSFYHFIIRPFILTRILFGLKPKQADKEKSWIWLGTISHLCYRGQEFWLRIKWVQCPYVWQQNVSAMVPWRVGLKFYLRSTFSFRGQYAASKRHHCRNTNVGGHTLPF